MRPLNLITAFAVIMIFCTSCTKLLLLSYGIHDMREEKITDLEKFCYKKGLDTTNLIFFADSATFFNYCNLKNEESKTFNIGMPELYVFNNKGECLKYKVDSACNGPGFLFTENVCSRISDLKNNNNRTFEEFKKYFRTSRGQEIKADPKDYDAIVVISWAKFTGKLNKDHVKIWENSLKKSKCKIKILKACLDPVKGTGINLKIKKEVTNQKKAQLKKHRTQKKTT